MGEQDLLNIARRRLHNVGLSGPPRRDPIATVRWLLAVQSQDHHPAGWSLAQRGDSGTKGDSVTKVYVDQLFDDGAIVRTHVLRPTWHYVAPQDLHWLQHLTAARTHRANVTQYRELELDQHLRHRCNDLIGQTLTGGNHLTRNQIGAVLADHGIQATGQRLGYIMMAAELDLVVCSGPLHGRQHTYALVDERVPDPVSDLSRDEALQRLVMRWFASHGPASLNDCHAWSGLPLADLRHGLALAGDALEAQVVDEVTYWQAADHGPTPTEQLPTAHLLQPYDEYFIGHRDTRSVINLAGRSLPAGVTVPHSVVIVDTQLAGHWRSTVFRNQVAIELLLFETPSRARRVALQAAADRHGDYLGVPATIDITVA